MAGGVSPVAMFIIQFFWIFYFYRKKCKIPNVKCHTENTKYKILIQNWKYLSMTVEHREVWDNNRHRESNDKNLKNHHFLWLFVILWLLNCIIIVAHGIYRDSHWEWILKSESEDKKVKVTPERAQRLPTTMPAQVFGTMSPYPTVVIVTYSQGIVTMIIWCKTPSLTTAHQRPSGMLLKSFFGFVWSRSA